MQIIYITFLKINIIQVKYFTKSKLENINHKKYGGNNGNKICVYIW